MLTALPIASTAAAAAGRGGAAASAIALCALCASSGENCRRRDRIGRSASPSPVSSSFSTTFFRYVTFVALSATSARFFSRSSSSTSSRARLISRDSAVFVSVRRDTSALSSVICLIWLIISSSRIACS